MRRSMTALVLALATTGTIGSISFTAKAGRHDMQAAPLKSDWIRANLMRAHYRAVLAIQDSVIRGDLEEVRTGAAALAAEAPPQGLPSSASQHVEAMRTAARRAADAASLGAAATATATLLATCGECHLAVGTRPAVIAPPSSAIGGVVGHMLHHQQAVELLLEGLVVPSASTWQDGAKALEGAPLRKRDLPPDPTLTRDVVAAETRIHKLAEEAKNAQDAQARTVVYGELLANCASCHASRRGLWGPPPR